MAKREELIITKVRENIINNGLLQDGDVIVLGLSGGPDSVFLLHVLQQLKNYFRLKYNINYDIIVCHINHMIRKEAKDDENLAKSYAEKYNLKFYALEKDVRRIAKESKISEEECGRNIRYEFFEKILKENKATKIAVAHNANDNAETILHNLMRGSGLNGISGIKVKNGNIIRPILNIEKKEIIKYLNENEIKYNIDKTNLTNDYTRNKIRNDLIKKIENEYNPNIVNTLNKLSKIAFNDIECLNEIASDKYKEMIIEKKSNNIKLNIKEFGRQSTSIKNRIIIFTITDLLGNVKGIEENHINSICDLMGNHITGKSFSIGNKFEVIIEKNKIANFIVK